MTTGGKFLFWALFLSIGPFITLAEKRRGASTHNSYKTLYPTGWKKDLVDVLLHESFAERPQDFYHALSIDDKVVLEKYKSSVKIVDNRFQTALPFKKSYVEVPNNYSYALNSMLKLEQRLKKNDMLHVNNLNSWESYLLVVMP